jgi:hypothetical protein
MRLPIALFAAATLLAAPASAEVFTAPQGFHFSLSRGSVSSPEDADLQVTPLGVTAKYGVRRVSRGGAFDKQEVAVLGEAYDLKDAAGGKWRMWIRTAYEKKVEVELIRVRRPAPAADRIYRAVAVTIDGMQAEPTFSALTLFADGSYRLGTGRGRYELDEGGVILDGVPRQWGRGAFAVNGEGLIFRFIRGQLAYEVKYEQQVNVALR